MLMLAEQVAAAAATVPATTDDLALLLRIVIGIQIVTALALVIAHRRIAKNEVEIAELLRANMKDR